MSADGALAGARVNADHATGEIRAVHVRVDAGDPLDAVVLRSYVTGAVHMALGWVLSESIAVEISGPPQTIRTSGIAWRKARASSRKTGVFHM